MRPLDEAFIKRVRETSAVVAGVVFLALAAEAASWQVLLSFGCGFGVAMLVWYTTEQVGRRLAGDTLPPARKLLLAAAYVGKYAVAALVLWSLERGNALDGLAFTGGFSIPLITVMLKAFGWRTLGHEVDPVPFYSRLRRPRKVG